MSQKLEISDDAQKSLIFDVSEMKNISEHARKSPISDTRKYTIFQKIMVDFVHWLETSGIFPTYKAACVLSLSRILVIC